MKSWPRPDRTERSSRRSIRFAEARELTALRLGGADATIVAMAERLGVANIATVDFKFLGMASSVSRLKPLSFVLQES